MPRVTASSRAARRALAWRPPAIRAPRPAIQGLIAFVVYLGVFIVGFALPVASNLEVPKVRQDWTDPNFYTWAMAWWPHAVSDWTNPLYSTQIGAPGGYSLAWATTTPSVALLMWPVTALFGAVVSFNLVLLLVPPLSGLTAFVAARRLTRRFWPALLAGAVYGLCHFELTHSLQGQPNLTVIALFPLMVYLLLLWWDGTLGPVGFAIWMAVAMALEFYTFTEAFFDMTAVWAGGLLIAVAVAGRAAWRKVARLAGLVAVAYAGAIVLAAPYLLYALHHYPDSLTRQLPIFSLRLVRLILPWSDRLFGLTTLVKYSDQIGRYSIENYVGIPMLVLLVALAVSAWSNRIARLLGIGFVFVIALAVGPNLIVSSKEEFPLPWAGLWHLPFARSAEPSRLIIFGYLALALALALWLAPPTAETAKPARTAEPAPTATTANTPKTPKAARTARASRLRLAARWGLGLLAVAAIIADLPTFRQVVIPRVPPKDVAVTHPVNALPTFLTHRMYRRYLTPGETVVIVTKRGNAGMLFQADADFYFRIAGGFINTSLTRQDALPPQVAALTYPKKERVQRFRAYVKAAGVGAIIVERAWAEPWTSVFGRIGLHGTTVGGVTIYPTNSPRPTTPKHSRTAGEHSTR